MTWWTMREEGDMVDYEGESDMVDHEGEGDQTCLVCSH